MVDNIGNDINVGDSVFCLSGKYKNTVQIVQGFREIKENLGDTYAVNFSGRDWLSTYNVISLDSLEAFNHTFVVQDPKFLDAIDHPLNVGDKVLFLHSMEMFAEIGTVQKLSPKSCLLSIQQNRFGQTEYRKKYEEIISLTAIGKDNIIIRKPSI